jgi:hypothetical protein
VRVSGVAAAGLAITGVLACAVPAAAAPVTAWTRIPRPGRMTATVLRVAVALPHGGHAPHELSIEPVRRERLPRGVVVIGAARLLVDSPRDTAVYVGVVAAFDSRAPGGNDARRPRGEPAGEARWRLTGEPLDGRTPATELAEFIEVSLRWRRALDTPPSPNLDGVPSALASNEVYNDVHAVSWDREQPRTGSVDADAALGATLESLMDGHIDPGLIGDIENALDARFPQLFPTGSLDGGPT